MNFIGDAAVARLGFRPGVEGASMPKVTGWQKGDEFEAAKGEAYAREVDLEFLLLRSGRTTEVVPFHKTIHEGSSVLALHHF